MLTHRNEPAAEIRDMMRDNLFACRDLLTAHREGLLRDRLQGVDIIQINAFHLVNFRDNVAWHGEIDHEEWPVQSRLQDWRENLGRQEWFVRGGGRN